MAADSSPSPGKEPVAQTQSPEIERPLEVDEEQPQDNDSAYSVSTGAASQSSSINSSILNYRYVNGRRYHAFREGTYFVPNDEEEQNRMDLVHHIYSLILDGKLVTAPISDNPGRVLDLGTGTGIWAIDFADEFPSAEVLGTDLSPIQPEWTPPNCVFEVDDFEADWLYHTSFDLIHARELEGCIGNDSRFFEQALENLSPGGYLEMQATLVEGSAKFGKPLDCAPTWRAKLEAAGFVDIHEDIRKVPIGTWPKDPKLKEIGKFQVIQQLKAVDSYTLQIFSSVLGWSQDEIQVFMAKVKSELKDPSIHLYIAGHFVWGRKPSSEAEPSS